MAPALQGFLSAVAVGDAIVPIDHLLYDCADRRTPRENESKVPSDWAGEHHSGVAASSEEIPMRRLRSDHLAVATAVIAVLMVILHAPVRVAGQ